MNTTTHTAYLQQERRTCDNRYSIAQRDKCEYAHQQLFYTAKEIATILSVSPKMVYKLMDKGVWEIIRIGTSVRISKSSFEEWLTSLITKE